MFGQMMNPIIRSDGNPKFAMISIMAVATIAGQILTAVLAVWHLFHMKAVKLGKAMQSSVLSMVREIVFGVGWAVILPIFFGLDGVLYSMPLSDLLTFVLAAVLGFLL